MYRNTVRTAKLASRWNQLRQAAHARTLPRQFVTFGKRAPQSAGQTTPQLQHLVARPTLSLLRTMATVTSETTPYKQSAFVQWKLFPDFERLLEESKPAQAVPIFEQLLDAAREQFLALEKHFEPTYEGTIGQCKHRICSMCCD